MTTTRCLLLGCWLFLGAVTCLGQQKPRLDACGDPLPEHAIARLGSLRFRGIGSSDAVLSPNGQLYALPGHRRISLFDATTGKLLRVIQGDKVATTRLTFSSDSNMVAAMASRFEENRDVPTAHVVQVWDVSNGKVLREIVLKEAWIEKLVVFGNRLAIVTGTAWRGLQLHVIDNATGKKVATMPLLANAGIGIAVSVDGEKLVTWGDCNFRGGLNATQLQTSNDSLQVWNPTTGKETQRVRLERLPRLWKSVAVSADCKAVAYSVSGTELRVRDIDNGKEHRLADSATPLGASLVFSPDGKTVASVTKQGAVGRWNALTGERLSVHKVASHEPLTLYFAPEGHLRASEKLAHVFRVTDVRSGKCLTPTRGHLTEIVELAFLGDGRLQSLSIDGVLDRWQPTEDKEPTRQRIHCAPTPPSVGSRYYQGAWFSPGGKHVVFDADGETVAVETESGLRLWTIPRRWDCVSLAPDGSRLALSAGIVGATSYIHLVDLRTGNREWFPREDPTRMSIPMGSVAAFSPDGKQLITSSVRLEAAEPSSVLRMWELATNKELWRSEGFEMAAFSPKGDFLAVASWFILPKLSLLDAKTGKQLRPFELGEDVTLGGLVYSPDGRTVAAPVNLKDVAKQLVVWETATGSVRLELSGEREFARAIAYSPDGSQLASGGEDTTVLLWDLTGRVARHGKPPPSATELDEAWTTLAAPDGRQAFRALSRLIAAPAEGVALCQRHLRPVAAADGAAVDRLIAALEQRRFAEREAAFGVLAALGASVAPALKRALAANPTLELRKRLEALLQHIDSRTLTPEELRRVRAVEVLERIGTAEAQRLLQKLAAGNPAARLSREASAALERWK